MTLFSRGRVNANKNNQRAGGTWTPIIILTQLDASYERVSALDDGADDYLSKPFDPAELASRIRAILRRTRGINQPLTAAARLVAGDLVYEILPNYLYRNGVEVVWRTTNWGEPPIHIEKYQNADEYYEIGRASCRERV